MMRRPTSSIETVDVDTLEGRPRLASRVTSRRHRTCPRACPRRLPARATPSSSPAGTRYTVFVARKPWTTVAEALAADPEDAAIIEGYAALDARVEGIAVYATSATTKRLQAAKRVATL